MSSEPGGEAKAASRYTATNAGAYEQLMGRWSRFLAEAFLAFAGIGEGEAILDVGCGTGSLTRALAARPEPRRIVGVDFARLFIDHAAAAILDPRVSFAVGDGCALDFPDHGFDRCYSLLALNFMSDAKKAIREMRRVTRPGGVIAAAVWDFAGGLVYQRVFWDTAAALDPAAAEARAHHLSAAMQWPGELEQGFAEAGATEIEGATLAIRMTYSSFADYWQPIALGQGPTSDYVKRLPPARLETLAAAVERAYLAGRPDGPRSMAAIAWAAKARA